MKFLKIAFVSLFFVVSTYSSAGIITQSGEELMKNPDVSFPNIKPSIDGSSILFGTGLTNPVLVRWNLFKAGTLNETSPTTTLTIDINLTRTTSDWDSSFGLWDGSNFAAVFPAYDGKGVAWVLGSSNGTTKVDNFKGSRPHDRPMEIGDSANFKLEYILSHDTTTINFSGLGTTFSNTMNSFDRTNSLSLLIAKQSGGEQLKVNSVSIESSLIASSAPKSSIFTIAAQDSSKDATSVPEPSTLAIFAFALVGLAAGRFRKQS